jgi:hypothetical protein
MSTCGTASQTCTSISVIAPVCPFSSPQLFAARRIVPTLQFVNRRAVQDFACFVGPIGRAVTRRGSLFSPRRGRTIAGIGGQAY